MVDLPPLIGQALPQGRHVDVNGVPSDAVVRVDGKVVEGVKSVSWQGSDASSLWMRQTVMPRYPGEGNRHERRKAAALARRRR